MKVEIRAIILIEDKGSKEREPRGLKKLKARGSKEIRANSLISR